jgi:peroxiredoxin
MRPNRLSRYSHIGSWRGAATAALALLVLALAIAPARAASPDDLDPLLRALSIRPSWGDPPPAAVVGVDGRRRSVSELRGQVALLYFWATWCPICTGELPTEIEAVHREFKERGLAVWAISFREAPERVTAWLERHPVSLTVMVDPDGTAANAFRATATPTFVLVDRAGQLVGRGAGPREWSGERGRALLRALLDGR